MNSFGRELAQIRKRANQSQYQLAKELNLSRSHIFRLENGERNPNKEVIEKIVSVLKSNRYDVTKLFILANLEPEINNTNEDFRMCFHLALELKNKGLLERAKYTITLAMTHFDNMIELHALLANLNLLNNEYDEAIKANEETLKYIEELSKEQRKGIGISQAEIIHNLGYVYFERGLEKSYHRDKLRIENFENNLKETEEFIEELKDEISSDFEIAIEKIQLAAELESDNLHIIDQLARIYYQKADLSNGIQREELFNKSIELYDLIIGSDSPKIENAKKQEASIFLAVALGKIFKINEASRLTNTIINYNPLYYFGYYAKGCIYSINSKNNEDFLETSYNSLVQALKLNSEVKEDIKQEIDLYNLRSSNFFKERFNELYSIQEKNDDE